MSPSVGPVFIAEDNVEDAELVTLKIEQACIDCPIHLARDGEEALKMLGERMRANELPIMIILDVRMPRVDGFEVLEWIRRQPAFAAVPVFMMSTSRLQRDIDQARSLGAQGYFEKFPDAATFATLFKSLSSVSNARVGAATIVELRGNLLISEYGR